jgi:magnesium-protoporphyrin O-methyltransferase
MDSYGDTRDRLTTYFDRTAVKAWEALTSDAPVSRIRATVRAGRDRMRDTLLAALPADLHGARVLDAGCGTGPLSVALALRGARVVGADLSPATLKVAADRAPAGLRIDWVAGDMLDAALGRFDFIVAMDSLIHYRAPDVAGALARLLPRVDRALLFTIAPKTPLLSAMHLAGKVLPRGDRSPAIVPHTSAGIASALRATGSRWRLRELTRVSAGFYHSQAMEARP